MPLTVSATSFLPNKVRNALCSPPGMSTANPSPLRRACCRSERWAASVRNWSPTASTRRGLQELVERERGRGPDVVLAEQLADAVGVGRRVERDVAPPVRAEPAADARQPLGHDGDARRAADGLREVGPRPERRVGLGGVGGDPDGVGGGEQERAVGRVRLGQAERGLVAGPAVGRVGRRLADPLDQGLAGRQRVGRGPPGHLGLGVGRVRVGRVRVGRVGRRGERGQDRDRVRVGRGQPGPGGRAGGGRPVRPGEQREQAAQREHAERGGEATGKAGPRGRRAHGVGVGYEQTRRRRTAAPEASGTNEA